MIVGRLDVKSSQYLLESVVFCALLDLTNRVNCYPVDFLDGNLNTLITRVFICFFTSKHKKESNRFVRKEFSGVFLRLRGFSVSLGLCSFRSWFYNIASRFEEFLFRLRQLFEHLGAD